MATGRDHGALNMHCHTYALLSLVDESEASAVSIDYQLDYTVVYRHFILVVLKKHEA